MDDRESLWYQKKTGEYRLSGSMEHQKWNTSSPAKISRGQYDHEHEWYGTDTYGADPQQYRWSGCGGAWWQQGSWESLGSPDDHWWQSDSWWEQEEQRDHQIQLPTPAPKRFFISKDW